MAASTRIEATIGRGWGPSYRSPFRVDSARNTGAARTFLFRVLDPAPSSTMIPRQGRCHCIAAHSMLNTKNFHKERAEKITGRRKFLTIWYRRPLDRTSRKDL